TPLVSDFGLAKRTDRDDDLTQGSGALGTPHFMPPEQTGRGFGEVGPHSDVYGLGATLYYLLTGRPPFVGEPHEVIAQVRTDPPAPPDPLPELRRELAEDGAATVIPERGLPRWHRMRLGENGPTEAPAHENACFLESTGHAMMDVLPAVGPGRYRVTLQIKQV